MAPSLRVLHHVVREGDSVGSIAAAYGLPRHVLVGANPHKGVAFLGDCGCCFDKPLEEDDVLTVPLLDNEQSDRLRRMAPLDVISTLGSVLRLVEGPGQDPVTSASRWVAACQAGTEGTGGQKYACLNLQYGAVAPFVLPGFGPVAIFVMDNINVGDFESVWGLKVLKTLPDWHPSHILAAVPFAQAAQAAKARNIPVGGAQEQVETNTPIQTGTTPGSSSQSLTQSSGGTPPVKAACPRGWVRNAQGKCVKLPSTTAPTPVRANPFGTTKRPPKLGGYGSVIDMVPGARLPTAGSARAIRAYGSPSGGYPGGCTSADVAPPTPGACPPPIGMSPSPCMNPGAMGRCLLTDCK